MIKFELTYYDISLENRISQGYRVLQRAVLKLDIGVFSLYGFGSLLISHVNSIFVVRVSPVHVVENSATNVA